MVHPTACLEKDDGTLITININGKQPKNINDYFHLWYLRFESDCIIQTGKSIREEPDSYDVPNLPDFLITP